MREVNAAVSAFPTELLETVVSNESSFPTISPQHRIGDSLIQNRVAPVDVYPGGCGGNRVNQDGVVDFKDVPRRR